MIRKLIDAGREGREINSHGEHYEVQEARIYTFPEEQATEPPGPIGDGYSTVIPDAELVRTIRECGGDKPVPREKVAESVTCGPDADRHAA